MSDREHVGPPPGEPICWTCEQPIKPRQGRNKDGWLVHQLCPIPVQEEGK